MGKKIDNVKAAERRAKNIFETIIYIITCIGTFGFAWLLKIVIKKAVMQANDNQVRD